MPAQGRYLKLDNLKCLLMFCVVFGHLLELFMGPGVATLYRVIYSFHMPAFAFCSGFTAAERPTDVVTKLLYPYLIFQTLYQIFAHAVLGSQGAWTYATPYWLMWYLMALMLWHLALPLLRSERVAVRAAVLCAAALVSILIGWVVPVGYGLSLSRAVVYFPFFIAGHFLRRRRGIAPQWKRRALPMGLLALCLTVFVLFALWQEGVWHNSWFYGSISYGTQGYTWDFRLLTQVVACVWIAFLLFILPNRNIPVISYIGAHTMPVYLLHGFLIKLLGKLGMFDVLRWKLLWAVLIAAGLLLALSAKPVCRLLRPLLRWPLTGRRRR
ncbi:MAG: acyltransferase family protein [Oscillospiraceae bacterium]|nr:acyltransferase family protein [Oscillospiraceae bacterium]